MKNMNKIISLLIFIALSSCTQKQLDANKVVTEESDSNINSTIASKEENKDLSPLNEEVIIGNYKGKIGSDLEVKFHLENNNGRISGFYFYKKTGIDIKIIGTVSKQNMLLYELDYKNDTLAILQATANDSIINGKWINIETKAEYPLALEKIDQEIKALPVSIIGIYIDSACNINLSISISKGGYYYKYVSKERKLDGKVSFSRGENLYLTLEGIEYAEDYFDVDLAEDDRQSEQFKKLRKAGKRSVGVQAILRPEELVIQNNGNAMNHYLKLYECDEKYIQFMKQ
jgi:hypothetical protein